MLSHPLRCRRVPCSHSRPGERWQLVFTKTSPEIECRHSRLCQNLKLRLLCQHTYFRLIFFRLETPWLNYEAQGRRFSFMPSVSSARRRKHCWYVPHSVATSISKHVPCQEVGDPGEYNTFLNSRPPSMELSAIQLVINICRETRVPCHIGRSQG